MAGGILLVATAQPVANVAAAAPAVLPAVLAAVMFDAGAAGTEAQATRDGALGESRRTSSASKRSAFEEACCKKKRETVPIRSKVLSSDI